MINFTNINILFEIGSFKVHAWGLMFVIAFIISFLLILREAKKQKIDSRHIYNIGLYILLGSLIGARLFYVIEHLPFFLQDPLKILLVWQGGLTSYGSLLAIFFVWLYIRKQKDLSFSKILDIMAPYIVLAFAITRIGCFLRGCCGGIATDLPWAVNGKHPTQLYESIYSMIIVFILLRLKKIKKAGKKTRFKILLNKKGAMFLYFLGMYSFFRFFNDFLRVYETFFFGFALSQWIALGIFVSSMVLLIKTRSSFAIWKIKDSVKFVKKIRAESEKRLLRRKIE